MELIVEIVSIVVHFGGAALLFYTGFGFLSFALSGAKEFKGIGTISW